MSSEDAGVYLDLMQQLYVGDITAEEFAEKMKNYEKNLSDYFHESRQLEEQIFSQLKGLKYE